MFACEAHVTEIFHHSRKIYTASYTLSSQAAMRKAYRITNAAQGTTTLSHAGIEGALAAIPSVKASQKALNACSRMTEGRYISPAS
jgi:hypothetical protein